MDSLATWPSPLSLDDRGFDAAAMRQLGRASSSSERSARAEAAEGVQVETAEEPAAQGPAPSKASLGEKLTASLLLVIPLVSATVVVLSALRWADSHNGWWLGVVAAVLVLAAVSWVAVLRRSFARAQGHLAARLPGVVGHGVGIIRELDVESPFDENGISDTVTAHLTLRVNPTQGPAFTGSVDAVYRAADAEKLEVGAHGPVRYLRSDPEASVTIDARLDAGKVQQIYRAAAMN
ncbi:hypothetical protein CWC38_04370 [Kocuria tytonicola]|uniref:hypothetical protein n=1 Tax=Kocuria tytonicola TaxID=2055946 RepID=UPI000EF90B10|nr:hypothetical protein [Kocuria tytonicola]RLZ03706.1 hypothetical protein CWC38_04370 [Kocuria tytonicola]